MSSNKFKTIRHIEAVRNYINAIIKELILRQEQHDQTKLESPEVEIFEVYTSKLRNCTYNSDEYNRYLKEMQPALIHHYSSNRHHPEHFKKYKCISCRKEFKEKPIQCDVCGSLDFKEEYDILEMNLIDFLEMLCDWKAAAMRHHDGDIYESLEINQRRFGYSDDVKKILKNTIKWLDFKKVFHKAFES